jgi:hypothetical protein
VDLAADARRDELVHLGRLATAEPAEVVAAALRADLLVLADGVLHLAGDELALLLGVLAARPQRGDPVGLGASGVADLLRDRRHLLGPRAEDVALQLLERALHRRELTANVAQLGLEFLGLVAPLAAMLAAHSQA